MTEHGAATDGRDPRAVPPLEPVHVRVAYRMYIRGRLAAYRLRHIAGSVDTGWRGVRILLYHRVIDAPGDPLAITPGRFRRQLESIRREGIEVIRLRDAYEVLARRDNNRYVVITLDDGYLDVLTGAEPVLRELEMPATVFLPTGIISGRERCTWYEEPPPFLDWDDVPRLTASGLVEVQPHGVGHFALPNLDPEQARAEILGSVRELEERAGVSSHTYSYPAGLYGARDEQIVADASLLGAVTCDAGVNDESVSSFARLRRTAVLGVETPSEFRALLGGALDDGAHFVRQVRFVRRMLLPTR